jgi:hypothetical protein
MKRFNNTPKTTGFFMCMALAIILSACGNGGTGHQNDMAQLPQPQYTMQQQVFCMAMISNLSSNYNYEPGVQDSTAAATNKVLNDAGIQALIGNWRCVWGPVVYFANGDTPNVAANTMFIAQQAGTANYVVAIAGTNGASVFDIVDEDLGYKAYGNSQLFKGNIMSGMDSALIKLQAMTSNGLTAAQFIAKQATAATNTSVYVTGHSLGGTVAPIYALYLHDSMNYWAPNSNTSINCLGIAGGTPGDSTFANYYNQQMGATTTRVWNTRDVVPHCMQISTMQQINAPGFYPQDSVSALPKQMSDTVNDFITLMKLTRTYYYQIQPSNTISFTSGIYTQDSAKHTGYYSDTAFLSQAIMQHVPAYGVYFNTLSFQQGVQRVLGLPYPFFTDGAMLVPVW